MSRIYLISSSVALAATLVALFPPPWLLVSIPVFFTEWLTNELAPHLIVIGVIANAIFVERGALHDWQGVVALAFGVLALTGLSFLTLESMRVSHVVAKALRDGFGDVTAPRPPRWGWLINPFWFRRPGIERIRNLSYGDAGRRNRIDVYKQRGEATGRPVLLQIHGGGWTISNKDQQGKPIMLHFSAQGWVCFAPNYRMSPKSTFPAHLIDVKLAIAWIREHAAEYGADPNFIVITGGSAGGHLSALAALTQNDPEYQPGFENADTSVAACIPCYGVYNLTSNDTAIGRSRIRMLERHVMKEKLEDNRANYEKASPHYRVREDAPPFFVIHGSHDSLVPIQEARRFVARLREVSRAPVLFAELPGAQHAFDVFPSIRTEHVIRAIERFVDQVRSANGSTIETPASLGADGVSSV